MNAFNLYEAAFDSACDDAETSAKYITQYADSVFDVAVSKDVAETILALHAEFTANGNGSNDYFHMIEKPLSEIEI